ncbi:hypothetical protein D3C73_1132920 [compost metagenome]
MIEKDAIGRMHAIGFTVIDRDPEGVELGDAVRRTRIKRGGFLLGCLDHLAVKFGGRSLIETCLLFHAQNADRFEDAQCAHAVRVCRVFRRFEAHMHVALCGKVINLIRLHFLNDTDQVGGVGHVAVMQGKMAFGFVRVFVKMVDAPGIEAR